MATWQWHHTNDLVPRCGAIHAINRHVHKHTNRVQGNQTMEDLARNDGWMILTEKTNQSASMGENHWNAWGNVYSGECARNWGQMRVSHAKCRRLDRSGVGIRISILEIPCMSIFSQNGQLWLFQPKNRFRFWNSEN